MPKLIGMAPDQVPANGMLGDMAFQSKEAVRIDTLNLGKASTQGLTLGDVPTYGFHDIIGAIDSRGVGASDPSFSIYTGTVLRQYEFSATTEQEVFINFHVPHDYVLGTAIFFHAHWSNAAATPNTGNVVWGFDYTSAKGHQQAAFPALTTITVTQACNATRYHHHIAETAAVTISGLEPDSLILLRGYRKAADAADTCTDSVFLHTMDVHYQSTGLPTKQKAPDFYT